ncbi:MAG: hypothetical protein ACRBBW_03965 [Cellvibrionaceae bacterium]
MAKATKQDVIRSKLAVHGAGEMVSATLALSVIEQLEEMLSSRLGIISAGVRANYSGVPKEHTLYKEAADLLEQQKLKANKPTAGILEMSKQVIIIDAGNLAAAHEAARLLGEDKSGEVIALEQGDYLERDLGPHPTGPTDPEIEKPIPDWRKPGKRRMSRR